MQSKAWYQSKTVIGALVAALANILLLSGVDISDLAPKVLDGIFSAISLVGALVAIYGRIKAVLPIGKPTLPPTAGGAVSAAPLLILCLALASALLWLSACAAGYSAAATVQTPYGEVGYKPPGGVAGLAK